MPGAPNPKGASRAQSLGSCTVRVALGSGKVTVSSHLVPGPSVPLAGGGHEVTPSRGPSWLPGSSQGGCCTPCLWVPGPHGSVGLGIAPCLSPASPGLGRGVHLQMVFGFGACTSASVCECLLIKPLEGSE